MKAILTAIVLCLWFIGWLQSAAFSQTRASLYDQNMGDKFTSIDSLARILPVRDVVSVRGTWNGNYMGPGITLLLVQLVLSDTNGVIRGSLRAMAMEEEGDTLMASVTGSREAADSLRLFVHWQGPSTIATLLNRTDTLVGYLDWHVLGTRLNLCFSGQTNGALEGTSRFVSITRPQPKVRMFPTYGYYFCTFDYGMLYMRSGVLSGSEGHWSRPVDDIDISPYQLIDDPYGSWENRLEDWGSFARYIILNTTEKYVMLLLSPKASFLLSMNKNKVGGRNETGTLESFSPSVLRGWVYHLTDPHDPEALSRESEP